jgi:hypothetical protein
VVMACTPLVRSRLAPAAGAVPAWVSCRRSAYLAIVLNPLGAPHVVSQRDGCAHLGLSSHTTPGINGLSAPVSPSGSFYNGQVGGTARTAVCAMTTSG